MPKMFRDPEAIAEDILRDVGPRLMVGLPLGLGKANSIANALYARAAADRSIDMTFFTARAAWSAFAAPKRKSDGAWLKSAGALPAGAF